MNHAAATMANARAEEARRGAMPSAQTLVTALVLTLCVVLVVVPAGAVVLESFNVGDPLTFPPEQLGLANYSSLVRNVRVMGNTVLLALTATAAAVFFGFVLAWAFTRIDLPGSKLLETTVGLPYYLTPLVGALAWSILAAPGAGWLNQLWRTLGGTKDLFDIYSLGGMAFVMALFEGPVAFIMISAAMKSMDPSLEECARVHGAGKWKTAVSVTLPMLRPAVLSTSLFVFAEMLGSFAAALVLGLPARIEVVTTAIWDMAAQYPPDYGGAAALGMALFAIMFSALYLYRRLIGGGGFATITGKAFRPRRMDIGAWRWVFLAAVVVYVLIAALLPICAVLVTSFQQVATAIIQNSRWTLENYAYAIRFAAIREAIGNSVILGLCVASIGVPLMGILVWIVYRTPTRLSGAVEQIVMFPQAIPRMVFGLALLWVWLNIPIGIYGTLWLLGIAYFTVMLPMGVRALAGVVLQIDRSLEECARVCGASWAQQMRTVTFPLLKPGLAAAWLLLFIASVRELGASVFLTSTHSKVLSPSIVASWLSGGSEVTAALAVIQTATILVVFAVVILSIRRFTRSRE